MKKDYETIEFEIIDFEALEMYTGDSFDFNSGEGDDAVIGDWDN